MAVGDRTETKQEIARTHMKRLLTWIISLAILGLFFGSYINYLIKINKPKITVVI